MKVKVIAVLIAIVLIAGTLTGCGAKNDYIATVNGEQIPIGYYTVYELFTKVQYENYYGDGFAEFMAAANESDPSKTNGDLLNDTCKTSFEQLYLLKQKVAELGLEIDALTQVTFADEYSYFKSLFNTEADFKMFLKKAGMTEEEFYQIYLEKTCYQDLIYNYYLDPDVGLAKYTDDDIHEFFLSLTDYAAKNILFAYATTDADGNALDASTVEQYRQQAKTEAEDALAKIKSGELDFDDAVNELSDDSSLALYPDGYGFKEGDGTLPEVFTTACKELNIGEYAIYESDYGFHIIKRLDLEDFYEAQKDTYELAYTTQYMTNLMTEWANAVDFQYNESALNKYNIVSSKRTNITLTADAFSS